MGTITAVTVKKTVKKYYANESLQIVDTRSIGHKTGENWLVECVNADHQELTDYFILLSEASEFANEVRCPECKAEREQSERNYEIQRIGFSLAEAMNYSMNAEFVFTNGSHYSTTGEWGGAHEIILNFGVETHSGFDKVNYYGPKVSGELRTSVNPDGTPVLTWAISKWDEGRYGDFETFDNLEDFKAAMFSKMEIVEAQFTVENTEFIESQIEKLGELGLGLSEINEVVNDYIKKINASVQARKEGK